MKRRTKEAVARWLDRTVAAMRKPPTRAEVWGVYIAIAAVVVVGLFLYSNRLSVEQTHREQDVKSNVEARYEDCEGGNTTRRALRKQVEQGRLQRPFLLKLLPQFDTPQVLALINKDEAEELKGYADRNCTEYSQLALPSKREGANRAHGR